MTNTIKTKPIETGMDLREARLALGWSTEEFARAVGLEGAPRTLQIAVSSWETESRGAPPVYVRLLAECFLQGARPHRCPKG